MDFSVMFMDFSVMTAIDELPPPFVANHNGLARQPNWRFIHFKTPISGLEIEAIEPSSIAIASSLVDHC